MYIYYTNGKQINSIYERAHDRGGRKKKEKGNVWLNK